MNRAITVRVPASSANLGVGYDVLALALDMYLDVTAELANGGKSTLSVEGEGADRLRWDDSNRFRSGFEAGWREARPGASVPALRIEMRNEIPLARGLGSSAAATVAGLVASRALRGTQRGGDLVSDDRLLELAAEIEGHPENAAASLHGGFVVCSAGRVIRYDPPPELRAVVFIPDRQLATDEMRAVLPQSVPHADAVHNIGRVALVVSAFASGDLSLLSAMYDDRLHEPYRAAVYPELPRLVGAARRAALGVALSGAGSAVIALCGDDRSASFVVDLLSDTAVELGLAGRCDLIRLATKGVRET